MDYIIYFIIAAIILAPIYLLYVSYKIKQAKRKLDWEESQVYTTLRIDVPKNNEKASLSAEQMFASIHGIYSEGSLYQNHLSFEIVARDKYIQFYVHVPKHLKDFVEGQIYAQYPTVEINEVVDYTKSTSPAKINYASCELGLTKPDVYPIKSFDSFEVDPLSGITSVMSKLLPEEEVWFQILVRPVGDEWQEKGNSIASAVRAGKKPGTSGILSMIGGNFHSFMKAIATQAINPGAEVSIEKVEVKLPATVEDALKGIEQKIMKLGFETKIRIFAIAKDPLTAKIKCQGVAAAFKQFNTTNLNGFRIGEIHKNNFDDWSAYTSRSFSDRGNILNITELASVYHLPHQSVETPSIVWSGAKKSEPPANLPLTENTPPDELTVLGATNFRNLFREFGIKRDDRRRHIYIVGKSGTGKSTLIENMAIDDVVRGKGVVIVDPHGELADKVLACVPDERIKDTIVFDPADRSFPIAFNLLEHVDDDFKGMVASGFVGIFKKIFGDSWGPRLEHILRNTVLALLDYPDSTMLDIPRMLTDNRFRDKVVAEVKDPVIREFWVNEFAQYDSKFRTEAVSPILNKVGQFLATATIRNIVGQPTSRINIREIMDQEKILIINLSRGKIGEDNSALLGAMIITKIQLAAMSRANISSDQRPDCYLYVDEFQNFATESFAVILSEARKYNLCLTMANQYIEQMSEEVRSAVFGNAGTIVTFRVGGGDAEFLVKEFEPVFSSNDLVNLERYTVYMKLLIDGIAPPAFSASMLPPVQKLTGNTDKIIDYTHEKYSSSRAYVEEQIGNRSKEEERELKQEAESFRQGGLEALLARKNGISQPVRYDTIRREETHSRTLAETKPLPEIIVQNNANEPEPIVENSNSEIKEVKEIEMPREEKVFKPRVFKYQNVIGDKLYKEQTTKGGQKWYVGEDIDFDKMKELGVEIDEEAKKFIELAKKAAGSSQTTINPIQTISKTEDIKEDSKEHQDFHSFKVHPSSYSHVNEQKSEEKKPEHDREVVETEKTTKTEESEADHKNAEKNENKEADETKEAKSIRDLKEGEEVKL